MLYHCFTDGVDAYTEDLSIAVKCIRDWFREGFRSLRIYKLSNVEDEQDDGECILSYGNFPY